MAGNRWFLHIGCGHPMEQRREFSNWYLGGEKVRKKVQRVKKGAKQRLKFENLGTKRSKMKVPL